MQVQAVIENKPLLRADQIEDMEGDRDALRAKMQNPHIQDKGVVREQLMRLDHQLETQRPTEYSNSEIDIAIKREAQLRKEWMQGMLSQEEMRTCPPGAVDAHLAWEKKNKANISEWQNIMRRLNAGSDAREIASIERYRPKTNTMNLDNAIVSTRQYFGPQGGVTERINAFSDNEIELLKVLAPEIAEKIALMTNSQRGEVKQVLTQAQIDGKRGVEKREANKAKRPPMTEEHKAKMQAARKAKKLNV